MPGGDDYRVKAAEINAKAQEETDLSLHAELEHLALAYLRLADQADRNAETDIVYEPPNRLDVQQPQHRQPQQQQQPQEAQPKKDLAE